MERTLGGLARFFRGAGAQSGQSGREAAVLRLLEAAQAAANADNSATSADILNAAVDQIKAAFGAKHACVHFVREEVLNSDTTMSGMASCPVAGTQPDLQPHLAGLEKAAMEQALAQGRPLRIMEVARSLGALQEAAGFEDGIIVPVAYQGEAFAWVNVFVPETKAFDAVEEGLLRTVGGVLYGAIKKEAFVTAIQRIRATLETHFSPRVVDKLIGDPESVAAHAKSERLDVTVLFSDIRGFTALSERLEPDVVAEMVGEHLEAMAEVVFEHDGIVDKYIGDSVMAVFGSPFPQDDHPQRAVACALAMVERQRALQDQWGERVMSPLAIGVGVNTGVAIVGDVGVSRREFTHLGDTVNLASRLKDVAKPWQVLVGPETHARVAGGVEAVALEPLQIKGKAEPVAAYEVTRYTGDAAGLRVTRAGAPAGAV
ncbi:MAG TPA: adenylate/guanylate cyclase domain-containing protein [Chloroflexota bacterium]|nr:adenylate/guanylate cyclase domain-containing protein [Chloroflexota bacterium]